MDRARCPLRGRVALTAAVIAATSGTETPPDGRGLVAAVARPTSDVRRSAWRTDCSWRVAAVVLGLTGPAAAALSAGIRQAAQRAPSASVEVVGPRPLAERAEMVPLPTALMARSVLVVVVGQSPSAAVAAEEAATTAEEAAASPVSALPEEAAAVARLTLVVALAVRHRHGMNTLMEG